MPRILILYIVLLCCCSDAMAKKKRDRNLYTDFYKCLRVETGYDRNLFFSVGFTKIAIPKEMDLEKGTQRLYFALETDIAGSGSVAPNFYGIKAGAEADWLGFLTFGMEFRYVTSFKAEQYIITPRLGISCNTLATLYYGRNLYDVQTNYFNLGHDQVSLHVNLSKRLAQFLGLTKPRKKN